MHFETPNNGMKCVLGIKESYFIAKIAKKNSHSQLYGRGG